MPTPSKSFGRFALGPLMRSHKLSLGVRLVSCRSPDAPSISSRFEPRLSSFLTALQLSNSLQTLSIATRWSCTWSYNAFFNFQQVFQQLPSDFFRFPLDVLWWLPKALVVFYRFPNGFQTHSVSLLGVLLPTGCLPNAGGVACVQK